MSSWLVIQRRFLAQERHRAALLLPRRLIQHHHTLQRRNRPTNPLDRNHQQRRRSLASTSWKLEEDLLLLKGSRLGLPRSRTPLRRSYPSFHDRSTTTTAAWSSRRAWLSTEAPEPDEQIESEPDGSEDQSTGSDSASSSSVDQPPLFDHGDRSTNATVELKNFLERQVGAFRSSIAFRRIRVLYETEHSSQKKVGWSAVFTCPVTKVMVSSKTLRAKEGCAWEAPIDAHFFDERALATATFFETKNKNRKKNMKNQSSKTDRDNDQATTTAALVMYTSWKQAKHAAAGAYLDAVQRGATGRIEPRFCVERPSMIVLPSLLQQQQQPPSSDDNKWHRRRTLPPLQWDKMTGPLAKLDAAFRYFYGRWYRADSLVTVTTASVMSDAVWESYGTDTATTTTTGAATQPAQKDIIWHAIFTCPVTGTQFPSSIYRDKKHFNSKNLAWYCQRDGIVYYSQKKEAINTAAARFFDAMACRMGIDDKPYDTSLRLCQDDPAILGDKLELKVIEDEKDHDDAEDDSSSSDDDDDGVGETKLVQSMGRSQAASGEPLSVEDYVVTYLGEDDGDSLTRPSDRLRALLNVAVGLEGSTDTASKIIADQRAVVDEAHAFAETLVMDAENRQSTNIHRIKVGKEDSALRLFQAKKMLSLLGDAVCATPYDWVSFGARTAANKIMQLLWRLDEKGRPDADLYALYIRCNDDRLPRDGIDTTSRLILAMNTGKNIRETTHTLPKPNIRTINAFIQLNAQQGGTKGRYADHTDLLQPDRHSFLSVLSSAIYEPMEQTDTSGFDPDFAADCIARMEELYEETQDASFQPDTQVYNAPLRWTGGPFLWVASRRYARSVPWDNYRSIYSRGLRAEYHDDDLRIQEAENISAWVRTMKLKAEQGQPTRPDIETYEALIQAWLRTITRKGLDEADRLFYELADGDDEAAQIRLQTLHPILASWFHSNEPDRWTKISDIIERWETLSDEKKSLDPRLMELKIAATMGNLANEINTQQEAMAAAKEITSLATSFMSSSSKNESSHYVVERAISAWEGVAELNNDGSLNDLVLSQLESVLNSYEDMARKATSSMLAATDRSDEEDAARLKTICRTSPLVYGSLVRVLTRVNQNNMSTHDDRRVSALFSRTVRSLGELTAILHQLKTTQLGSYERQVSAPAYGDRFSYRLRDKQEIPHPMSMLWNMITYFGNKIFHGSSTNDEVQSLALIYLFLAGTKTANRLRSQIAFSLDQAYPGMSDRLKHFERGDNSTMENAVTEEAPRTTRSRAYSATTPSRANAATTQLRAYPATTRSSANPATTQPRAHSGVSPRRPSASNGSSPRRPYGRIRRSWVNNSAK